MKRKDYSKLDPSLVDAGWKQMKKVLDREMPEKRRWRLFVWFPALAAASVIGFILITMLQIDRVDTTGQEVAQPPLTTFEPDKSNTEIPNEISSANGKIKNTFSRAVPEGKINTETEPALSDLPEKESLFVVNEIEHQPERIQGYYSDVKSSPIKKIQKINSLKIEDLDLVYTEKADLGIRDVLFKHLPQPIVAPEKIEIQRVTPDLIPGLAFGSGTNLSQDKFSWIAGPSLKVSWKKTFLKTTVQYWNIYSRKAFFFNENTGALTEATNVRATPSQDQVGVSQPIETVYSEYDVDQIQYFRTSVKTGYFLGSKISPVIGVSTIFLLGDKVQFKSGRPPTSLNNQQMKAFNEQEILRKTNIAVDIGLNYRLSSNFILSLNYTHPWHSYLKTEFSPSGSANITRQLLMGIHFQLN